MLNPHIQFGLNFRVLFFLWLGILSSITDNDIAKRDPLFLPLLTGERTTAIDHPVVHLGFGGPCWLVKMIISEQREAFFFFFKDCNILFQRYNNQLLFIKTSRYNRLSINYQAANHWDWKRLEAAVPLMTIGGWLQKWVHHHQLPY